ncbi:MAG: tRNA 2-thiouridine(34) synthase MnmA [Spirochaetales bacterium]
MIVQAAQDSITKNFAAAWTPETSRVRTPARTDSIGVLVSGGVDSSVALARLSAAGFTNITAFYLKIWLEDDVASLGDCPWEDDLGYARLVCRQFDIPLEVVPLQTDYYDRVVEYTLSELRAGRTPSPDIFCNQRIKFGAFLERVGERTDWVASGHYGRVVETDDGDIHLYRSPDPVKDQSYFLSHLGRQQLSRALFPIGELRKADVRTLADRLALANRSRPDSQGICFLGKIRYPDFVRYYLGEREGRIVERETGRVLGSHRGFWFYTIGQRQGLGLSNGPWYVTGKDVSDNVVFVTHREAVYEQASGVVELESLHWIGREPDWTAATDADAPRRFSVKLRHGPKRIACRLERAGAEDNPRIAAGDGQNINLHLSESDRGVAPGQFGVLYDGERCLGAGRIRAGYRA